MSRSTVPDIDIVRFLKLTGPGARAILGLFLLTQYVLAFTTLDGVRAPWVSIVALAFMTASAVLVMTRAGFPLPRLRTALVLAGVVVSTVLVSWNLPPRGWPGYASWHLGANTFILLALGLRGRIGMSWTGMAAMAVITISWTVTTVQGTLAGVGLVDREAGTLLIGMMFAVAFHRTARRMADYNETSHRRAVLDAEAEASERTHERQAVRLQTTVRPALELIAGPTEISDGQRQGMRVLEATIRDEIRAGSLLRDPLTSSVRHARERGLDVQLLDDSSGVLPADAVLRDAVAWAAGAVDSLERGRAVIRLRPPGHGPFASLHIADGERSRTIEYP